MTLPTSIFYIFKPHLTLHLPPLKSSPTSATTILYSIYLIGNIECTTYVYSCGNIFSHSLLCECLHCHPLVHKSVKSSLNFDVGSSFGFRASIESSLVHSIVHLKVFISTQKFSFFLHIKISTVDSRGILAHPLNTNLSYNKEQQFRPWLFKYISFPFWVTLFYLPPQNSLNSVFGFCTPSQSLLKVSHICLLRLFKTLIQSSHNEFPSFMNGSKLVSLTHSFVSS